MDIHMYATQLKYYIAHCRCTHKPQVNNILCKQALTSSYCIGTLE